MDDQCHHPGDDCGDQGGLKTEGLAGIVMDRRQKCEKGQGPSGRLLEGIRAA
jgi:hypothetical protein